jgi:hypothetical protein
MPAFGPLLDPGKVESYPRFADFMRSPHTCSTNILSVVKARLRARAGLKLATSVRSILSQI